MSEARTPAEDRKLIEEAITGYASYLDFREFDAFQRVFARDATWNRAPIPTFGRPLHGAVEIRTMMEKHAREAPADRVGRHLVNNVIFDEQTAETARTRSYVTVLTVTTGATPSIRLRGVGVYHDRFIREDGRWVIAERLFNVDYLD